MNEAHFSEIPNNRNNNALECAFIILDGFEDLPVHWITDLNFTQPAVALLFIISLGNLDVNNVDVRLFWLHLLRHYKPKLKPINEFTRLEIGFIFILCCERGSEGSGQSHY